MAEISRAPRITRDECIAHITESTFRLRPSDWRERYPLWPGAVGLEIEMLPVAKTGGGAPGSTAAAPPASSPASIAAGDLPRGIPLQGRNHSLAAILRSISPQNRWTVEDYPEDVAREVGIESPMLAGITMDVGDKLSFEPGGQLEFSSIPYPCLTDAVRRMRQVQGILDERLAQDGIELVQLGINPWHTVEQINLQMRKPRYRAMNEFFSKIGPAGQRMMRQTCTVQVNLDFGPDETTLAKRFLVAQLLAPITGAVFANSGFVDGRRNSLRGLRSQVWLDIDPSRTGVPRGLDRVAREWTKASCVAAYVDLLMNSKVVFVAGLGYRVPQGGITWGEWLDRPIDGVYPTKADLETQLSLLFPEVRARGFLELRSVDCQPRAWQVVPAAFWIGILYDPVSLDGALELLNPHLGHLSNLLGAVPRTGVSSGPLRELSGRLMELAIAGFGRLAPCFKGEGSDRRLRVFAEHFTMRGRAPIDDLWDVCRERAPSLDELHRVEANWARLLV